MPPKDPSPLDDILDGSGPTQFDGLTDAQLSKAYKEGRISQKDYTQELTDRGKTNAAINELLVVNKPIGITPPSLPGAGLADPNSGVKPPSPYAKLSESELQQYVEAGIMTRAELVELKGEANAGAIMAQPLSANDKKAIAALKAQNPTASSSTTGAAAAAGAAGTSSRPSVSSGGGLGGSGGSSAAAAAPAIAGNYVWNNGRPFIEYQGQRYMLPQGTQEDDPKVTSLLQRLGAGKTEGSVVGNTKSDLYLRGGLDLGKATILNGQQYRPVPGAEKDAPYANTGAALTSRLGNSPTAKAAGGGGFGKTIDPNKALFNTIGLDESIAAGATKGSQVGDILGTISNNTGRFNDITLGGVSEGGGLTPVGNSMNPYDSFTGQMTNGDTIGMSSILGNSGHDTQYWLSQMSGLPPAEVAKLNINTPEKALQFQQAVETLRAQGMMPNFASLYALNEPAATGGAYGGSDLKWGSANGGASNTPYDQALAGFKDYALGSPDLAYLPEPSGYGSTQIGNTAYANSGLDEYGRPLEFANGGSFMTDEPIMGVGVKSQRPKFLMGEAGPEKVTIDPMKDVMMGRERNQMHTMGQMPQMGQRPNWQQMMQQFQTRFPEIAQRIQQAFSQWQNGQGGLRPFAAGGEIYAGGNKGFTSAGSQPIYNPDGSITEYGTRLGYKSDPTIYTGGATANADSTNFVSPNQSKTGQPLPASFERMGAEDRERFTNQGGRMGNQRISGTVVPTQEMYLMGDSYVPVYTQGNPNDYSALGEPIGYDYIPYNVGSTPGVVKVPKYNTPMPDTAGIANEDKQNLIRAIQNTDPNFNYNGIGFGNPAISQAVMSGNKQAMLAALYDVDPKAALLLSAQMNQQGQNDPMGGNNTPSSQDIQNQAYRDRFHAYDTINRNRGGMPEATMLNIPRVENWTGTGPAPYQRFNGTVPEGFYLPSDYEPGSPWFNRDNQPMGGGMGHGGGWRGGDMRTPEPWGGGGMSGGQQPGQGQGGGMGGGGWQGPQMPPQRPQTPFWGGVPWMRGRRTANPYPVGGLAA